MENSKSRTGTTLFVVMITSFITPFMSNAINLAIPSIGVELNGNQNMLNWVVSAFLIATAAFLLPFGRLADQLGRKKIYLIGMILMSVSSLACALATSLAALVCFRIVQGIASAMVFSTAMAILTSVVPPERRGRALGLNSAATYIGLSSGPVLGGLLTSAFTWRSIFYFNTLMAVVVIVIALWKLKGEWKGEAVKMDAVGIILCIFGQALLLLGLTDLTKGIFYQVSFGLGIIFLVGFFIYEKYKTDPLIPVGSIIKNKPFAFSNLATLINYSATFALSFILSLYLQTVLGIDTAASGLVLLVQPIIMAVLSPVAGVLSDRIRPELLASAGMGISALGLFFFIFLTPQTSIVLIILNLAFIGLGFALFATPNTHVVMGSIDRPLYGVGSSILGNMRLLGQSISMAVVSLITSFFIGELAIGTDGYIVQLMVSLRIAFIIFAVLCTLGVFASLVRGKAMRGQRAG